MNHYNFDSGPEGEWDDRGDISWNEFDWQQFLKRNEEEILRFSHLYERLEHHQDRLDQVAQEMGWEADDWSINDTFEDEASLFEEEKKEEERDEDLEPYTLHRHPVYILTRALLSDVRHQLQDFTTRPANPVTPRSFWKLAIALSRLDHHSLMSLQALDLGDFALTVAQMKGFLEAINETFRAIQPLESFSSEEAAAVVAYCRVRLFDLREIGLRIMNDCRDEIRHHWGDQGAE